MGHPLTESGYYRLRANGGVPLEVVNFTPPTHTQRSLTYSALNLHIYLFLESISLSIVATSCSWSAFSSGTRSSSLQWRIWKKVSPRTLNRFHIHRFPMGNDTDFMRYLTLFCYFVKHVCSCVFQPGPDNLRSFLTANSTKNHFLIAHMLSFL